MTYSNPDIQIIENPIGIDKPIQDIQNALAAIPWIDKAFGRAWTGRRNETGGKVFLYPEVYQGGSEYYPCLINDHFKGMSFVKVRDDQTRILEYNAYGPDKIGAGVDVIVTFRLDLIDLSNHRNTEALKREVKDALKSVSSIERITRIYEDPNDVFKGYSLDHAEWQTFKHPRGGFKFECDLNFTEECQ